jgi:hypothetical protein
LQNRRILYSVAVLCIVGSGVEPSNLFPFGTVTRSSLIPYICMRQTNDETGSKIRNAYKIMIAKLERKTILETA